MIAKLRTSRYEPGRRSKSWLKVKIRREQEVVVVGYEPGKGARADLGSLILAVYEGKELRYAGEVGSGLDAAHDQAAQGRARRARASTRRRWSNPPRIKGAVWSEPRLVVRVEFSGVDRRRLRPPGRVQGTGNRQGPEGGCARTAHLD